MTKKSAAAQNIQIGHELQARFDFYLVALTFTVLGLAVQTSAFGTSLFADATEVFGWVSLLVSGFAGLDRLAWLPQVYQLIGYKKRKEGLVATAREEQLRGASQLYYLQDQEFSSLDEFIDSAKEGLEWADEKIDELKNQTESKYKIHTRFFYIGLVLLVVSRAAEPVSSILVRIGVI